MNKVSLRLYLAVALLIISLAALTWGLLPGERVLLHQTIQPTEMLVPTPQGFLPTQGGQMASTWYVLTNGQRVFLCRMILA